MRSGSRSVSRNGAKRPFKMRIAKLEPFFPKLVGRCALAAEHQDGGFSQYQTQRCRRDGEQPGASQHAGQAVAEAGIGDGFGRRQIVGAAGSGAGKKVADRADLIIDVNPAHPLPAAADTRSEPQSETPKHWGQHASIAAQYQACADDGDTDSQLFRRQASRFPVPAQQGAKVLAARLILSQDVVMPISVIAYGRPADQHGRGRRATGHPLHGFFGEPDPAVAKNLLAPFGPSGADDARSREVDDGIHGMIVRNVAEGGEETGAIGLVGIPVGTAGQD